MDHIQQILNLLAGHVADEVTRRALAQQLLTKAYTNPGEIVADLRTAGIPDADIPPLTNQVVAIRANVARDAAIGRVDQGLTALDGRVGSVERQFDRAQPGSLAQRVNRVGRRSGWGLGIAILALLAALAVAWGFKILRSDVLAQGSAIAALEARATDVDGALETHRVAINKNIEGVAKAATKDELQTVGEGLNNLITEIDTRVRANTAKITANAKALKGKAGYGYVRKEMDKRDTELAKLRAELAKLATTSVGTGVGFNYTATSVTCDDEGTTCQGLINLSPATTDAPATPAAGQTSLDITLVASAPASDSAPAPSAE